MPRFVMFISLLSVLLVLSCTKKASEEELLARIQEAETAEKFTEAAELLEEYLNRFPDAPKAPENMNKLAMIYASSEKDFETAVALHRKIIEKYPESKYVVQSQFMIGYIYANEIKDYDRAKLEYERFLELYPDHELVPSVKWELENLGKDLSEIEIFAKSEKSSGNGKEGAAKK